MTAAAYFDLKKRIFRCQKAEATPVLSGTATNWSTSYMKPVINFTQQCSKSSVDSDDENSKTITIL